MPISTLWMIASVLLLTGGLVWLAGPVGLLAGAAACFVLAVATAPGAVTRRRGDRS